MMTGNNEMVKALLVKLPSKPNPSEVLDWMTAAFEQLADRGAYSQSMETVVPGMGFFYGVRVPELRALAKGVRHTYKQDQTALKQIALSSWKLGSREHELFGLFLLGYIKTIDPSERWSLGEQFLPRVAHWEACDQLCAALLGEALAQDASYMDTLEAWVDDHNLWVRRAALVSTVFLRRGKFPPEIARDLDKRTLAICDALLDDKEHYIRKAVDFAIREVIRRNYEIGREWMLAQAAKTPSTTARSTLKLASRKLQEADRDKALADLGS